MSTPSEFDQQYAREQLRRARHPLRRLVKKYYLRNTLKDISGATIDFGCGAGQLLECLPPGSVGLEVNPYLIRELTDRGLDVRFYDGTRDDFELLLFEPGRFSTLVMSHVLEHFPNASEVLRKLLRSCRRLRVQRVVIVVPGKRGFRADATHKTMVDRRLLDAQGLMACEGYRLGKASYFPMDVELIGDYFAFHELKVIYERIPE